MDFLKGKQFDVEHMLSLYAVDAVSLPAEGLYQPELLQEMKHLTRKCHIYIVGFVPRTNFTNMTLSGRDLRMTFEILGKSYDIVWELPKDGLSLIEKDGLWGLFDGELEVGMPSLDDCAVRLNAQYGTGTFLVKYIGQAYGKDGSRNALDRLIKHEKLQEIAIKGVPDGYRFQVVMLSIAPTQVITMFLPNAVDDSKGEERIGQGLDKLFGTDEKERVSLYEAALIRYFQPSFNKDFINSFPSTNLAVLQECYAKDFSAVAAEILLEPFPFTFFSEAISPKRHHTAFFDLHDDEARKVFFAKA